MTKELLSEVVGKMNEACEGTIILRFSTDSGTGWWLYHQTHICPGANTTRRYSPILTICQLVDWCEAWLRGAEEIRAIFAKNVNG